MNEPASLQSLNPLILESIEVTVIDVSAHGLSVQSQRHIAVQSEVKVRREGVIIFGEVRYCIPLSEGFRAGIRIKETLPTPRASNS